MDNSIAYQIIAHHIPAQACSYCYHFMTLYTFELVLKRPQTTKIGDFTFRAGKIPRITINDNINPYLFLIVYLHEIAHLDVHQNFSSRVHPHGKEWKHIFQKLMNPVMYDNIFPLPLLTHLKAHMRNPTASVFSSPILVHTLRQYDKDKGRTTLLYQLAEGTLFLFGTKWFKKGKLKRTRIKCYEIKTKTYYLIPHNAPIKNAQLNLF